MDRFITAHECFYHGNCEKQNKVLNEELDKFKDQACYFAKLVAREGRKIMFHHENCRCF
jgi:hypothetical protein